jgi:hypothetical protein
VTEKLFEALKHNLLPVVLGMKAVLYDKLGPVLSRHEDIYVDIFSI